MTGNQVHLRRILEELERDPGLPQRALAARVGVSLGLVNQLLQRAIAARWIARRPFGGRRLRYILTPEGTAAAERLAREQFDEALVVYGTVRDRVRRRLEACADGRGLLRPAVVLYGIGDVAQIAFACATEAGVQLVGFVDERPLQSYLGLPVRAPGDLASRALDGRTVDWVLVTTLVGQDVIRCRLEAVGFPLERVSWL